MVRQAIRVGFLDRSEADNAAEMAAKSCPSTLLVAQPAAAKRFSWSSEVDRSVPPSIEMEL